MPSDLPPCCPAKMRTGAIHLVCGILGSVLLSGLHEMSSWPLPHCPGVWPCSPQQSPSLRSGHQLPFLTVVSREVSFSKLDSLSLNFPCQMESMTESNSYPQPAQTSWQTLGQALCQGPWSVWGGSVVCVPSSTLVCWEECPFRVPIWKQLYWWCSHI